MELRTQGSKPRTALPRKDPLEAKDRNAEGLEHKRKCSPRKSLQKFLSGNFNKKGLQKFFSGVLSKKRLLKFFFRCPTKFQQSKKSFVLEPRTGQFSRTRSQSQGLQNVFSRPRMSSRTQLL